MFSSRTISIAIARPLDEVYAFACVPENFLKWVSGLAGSLKKQGDDWIAETPQGRAHVRFSEANPYGVLDYWVTLPNRMEIYIPLRAIANDGGAEVALTLFRLSEMDELGFERDANLARKDLRALKALLEDPADAHA